jgi:hypothetical protein
MLSKDSLKRLALDTIEIAKRRNEYAYVPIAPDTLLALLSEIEVKDHRIGALRKALEIYKDPNEWPGVTGLTATNALESDDRIECIEATRQRG